VRSPREGVTLLRNQVHRVAWRRGFRVGGLPPAAVTVDIFRLSDGRRRLVGRIGDVPNSGELLLVPCEHVPPAELSRTARYRARVSAVDPATGARAAGWSGRFRLGYDRNLDVTVLDPGEVGLVHQADSLTDPCSTASTSHSPAVVANPRATWGQRQACIDAYRTRGYTHFYVNVHSRDSEPVQYDYYERPPAEFRAVLQQLRDADLFPVVWLTTYSNRLHGGRPWSEEAAWFKRRLDALIPAIDDLVASYVLGWELSDYWTEEQAAEIGRHLRTLTGRPLAAHDYGSPDRTPLTSYCADRGWCDYLAAQYEFPRDPQRPEPRRVRRRTADALAELGGKPLVAVEYSFPVESTGIVEGDAAMRGGAVGFGNAGTPRPLSELLEGLAAFRAAQAGAAAR